MPSDETSHPAEDVQHALETARNPEASAREGNPYLNRIASDVLADRDSHPILRHLQYAWWKSGLMAEKYPWQSLALGMISIACGWVCPYFGATVLLGAILYAVYAPVN